MGNSKPVAIIANSQTQPEGIAVQQLYTTAHLDHIQAAAGMPDLHAGRGYPIGAAFFSTNHFYPSLIGSDIGCGMALFQTDLKIRKYSAEKLEKRIGNIDDFPAEDWQVRGLEALGRADFLEALGTIGGGNHFAEIQQVDTIFSPEDLPPNFEKNTYQLLVHSGSRGLGGQVLRQHIEQYGHAGLPADSPAAHDYLQQHDFALQFARLNRQFIAERIGENLGATLLPLSNTSHNQLTPFTLAGEVGYLHRKGAAPTDDGLVVIAGSRDSYSYLVKPTGKEVGNLASIAHGAGRKWQRGACKGRLSHKYRPADLSRNRFGGRVICEDRTLIYDEAPQAYRNIEHTIAALVEMALIVPVLRLKPILTYKTRGGQ